MALHTLGRSVFSVVLSLSLILSAQLPYQASVAQSNDKSVEEQPLSMFGNTLDSLKRDNFLQEYMKLKSFESAPPTEGQASLMLLENQNLSYRGQKVNLSLTYLDLPTPFVTDIDAKKVQKGIDKNGDFFITAKKINGEIYTHTIGGVDFVTFTESLRYMYLLAKDGSIYTFEKKSIKEYIFNAPIPVSKVGHIPEGLRAEDLHLKVAKRESPVIFADGVEVEKVIREKDLLIINPEHRAVGRYSSEEMQQKYFVDILLLSRLVAIGNPDIGNSEQLLLDLNQLFKEESRQLTEAQRKIFNELDLDSFLKDEEGRFRNNSRYLSSEMLQSTLNNMKTLKEATVPGQQIFVDSWIADSAKLAEAKRQDEEKRNASAQRWHTKFFNKSASFTKSLLSVKSLKRIGIYSLLAAGIIGGVPAVGYATNHHELIWSVAIVKNYWMNMSPVAFQHPFEASRVALILSLAVPMMWTVGTVVGKFKNWDAKTTLTVAGMRIYGGILSVFEGTAKYARQRNLLPALRSGLSPFEAPEMFNLPWEKSETLAQRRVQLDKKAEAKRLAKSISWMVAHAKLLERENINPVHLLMWQQYVVDGEGFFPGDEKAKREFFRKWEVVASDINSLSAKKVLAEQDKGVNLKVYFESSENIEMIRLGEELANEWKENSVLKNRFLSFVAKLKRVGFDSMPKFVGNYGYSYYKNLISSMPSTSTSSQFFRQYSNDYLFSAWFYSFFGERADLAKPGELTFQKDAFLEIHPAHRAEFTYQNSLYLTASASLYLVYDSGIFVDKTETNNWLRGITSTDPELENALKNFVDREAGLKETLVDMAKGSVDFPARRYGDVFIRGIKKSLMTLPAGLAIGLLARVGVGRQEFVDAVPAQLWGLAMAIWAYGYPWPFVNSLITQQEHKVEVNSAKLRLIQGKLAQALERNDPSAVNEYTEKLQKIYKENNKEHLIAEFGNLSGNEKAKKILIYSLKHPVAPTKANQKLLSTIVWIGAITTTYLATSFSVVAFGHNDDWTSKMIHGWSVSAALYTSVFAGFRALETLQIKIRNFKAKRAARKMLLPRDKPWVVKILKEAREGAGLTDGQKESILRAVNYEPGVREVVEQEHRSLRKADGIFDNTIEARVELADQYLKILERAKLETLTPSKIKLLVTRLIHGEISAVDAFSIFSAQDLVQSLALLETLERERASLRKVIEGEAGERKAQLKDLLAKIDRLLDEADTLHRKSNAKDYIWFIKSTLSARISPEILMEGKSKIDLETAISKNEKLRKALEIEMDTLKKDIVDFEKILKTEEFKNSTQYKEAHKKYSRLVSFYQGLLNDNEFQVNSCNGIFGKR